MGEIQKCFRFAFFFLGGPFLGGSAKEWKWVPPNGKKDARGLFKFEEVLVGKKIHEK